MRQRERAGGAAGDCRQGVEQFLYPFVPPRRQIDLDAIAERRLGAHQRGLRTPEAAYYQPILKALDEFRGRAKMNDVLDHVEQLIHGKLAEVDYLPSTPTRSAALAQRRTVDPQRDGQGGANERRLAQGNPGDRRGRAPESSQQ